MAPIFFGVPSSLDGNTGAVMAGFGYVVTPSLYSDYDVL